MSVSPSRRFLRNEEGAIALEFAIVAPVFFAIVFSIFEAGWMMTKVMMLEMALDKTVRELRVGPELAADLPVQHLGDGLEVLPGSQLGGTQSC